MIHQGIAAQYSTYIPVTIAALVITFLEIFFPYNKTWRPNRGEIRVDISFMVIVQVLLPQFLSYLVAISLIEHTSPLYSIWPGDWPVCAQVVLMILIADFMRYWLHRACHRFLPLWQFHAVHHSPTKLYGLNVGRFHPLEKAVQFLFDALPFIALGVNQSLLSVYFIFYAVNGYFQHSNVNLKMGWLNYIISGPELHRWHHSVRLNESNRNFGNNIIIWDLIFGTYFLPKNRGVALLGLKNRAYPTSFIQQLQAPLINRLESKALPQISCVELILNYFLKIRILYLKNKNWQGFINSPVSPWEVQDRLLDKIVRANRSSRFGQDHDFEKISNYDDFRKNCPVQTYDSLSAYIDIADVSKHGLTTEKPSFYQVTSGTGGSAKYLPVTQTGLNNNKTQQNMMALARYLYCPASYMGKIFGIVSPAIEGYTKSGLPFGSVSGLVYRSMPRLARAKYAVPYPVFEIDDYDLKYQLLALIALAQPQVTMCATANPSTMIRLLEIINQDSDQLLHMLSSGCVANLDLSDELAAVVLEKIQPDPKRAAEIRTILNSNGLLNYSDIWPYLQQLVIWTGGSCGIALSALKQSLPLSAKITELGYMASEFRGTITVGKDTGMPTIEDNFYEFVPRDDWEAGNENVKLIDELEAGKQYYIIVTTVNGLYRYFMNDIVEVGPSYKNIPTLNFIQKGRGVTSITGEKLYESQTLDAVRSLETSFDLTLRFQIWMADENECRYRVYLEVEKQDMITADACSRFLDNALSKTNLEYANKRRSGRLKPLSVSYIKAGTAESFKKCNLKNGQREGQYKSVSLVYSRNCRFPFEQHAIDSP